MGLEVCIIFHSETGNTRAMAEVIAEGVKMADGENNITTHLWEIREIDEEKVEILNRAQVVMFGSPTYLGDLSWQMKQFMDTLHTRNVNLQGKLAAAFASARMPGGGGYEESIVTIMKALIVLGCMVYTGGLQAGKVRVHFGAVSQQAPKGMDAERCRVLGENIAQKALELFTTG